MTVTSRTLSGTISMISFSRSLLGRRELLIDPSVLDAVVDDVLASARVRLAQ